MEKLRTVLGFIFNNYVIKHATLIIAFLMLFYTWQHGRYNGNYINSDGKGYYAYLTAIFIYQDLEYGFIDEYESKYYAPESYVDFRREVEGGIANITFAGIALFFLPFFLAAHLGSMVLGLPTDGYAPLYQYGIGFAAIFYLLLALWGIKKFLELYGVNKYHVALVQVLIVFATPIYFYTTVDASFTHIYTFSAFVLFFYYMKRYIMTRRAKHLYLSSLLLALIILMRPTNMMIAAAIPFLAGDWESLKSAFLGLFKHLKELAIALVIFFGILAIQPALYYVQVGQFFVWTYTGLGFNFLDPHIFDVLFSYRKGLFVYTPILIFAIPGFIYLFRKSKYQALTLLAYCLIVLYVISSWRNWWYGMSFGHRAFLDHYIVFALLLGLALTDTKYKVLRYLIYVATPLVIWMNMVQVFQYKNWILYWNMDEEKYWRVFMKTDEKYFGMLWREAKQQEQEEERKVFENRFKNLTANNTFYDDYEGLLPDLNANLIEKEITRSGETAIWLNIYNPYSPGIKTEIRNLRDSTRILLRASAYVYVPEHAAYNPFHLVFSVENEEGVYVYQSVDSNPEDIKTGEWNEIRMAAETKEIKSPGDIMKVYVWYSGKREVIVDDFTVEFF
ncbi:MAG: hypothetical protein V2I47_01465 [Bacteroidales bacterium]|jgi:hypothetical protein|nr:hypothetical protein [Bacteroidales bacterium]